MIALLDLAVKVEALSGPCRETDAEILMAIGGLRDGYVRAIEHGKERPYFWHGTDEKQPTIYAARFTESLDAAMTLVPDGAGITVSRYWIMETPNPVWSAEICTGGIPSNPRQVFDCYDAATPALALTAAALRAKATQVPA